MEDSKEIKTFDDLVGKTIKSATQMQRTGYTDTGFLHLTFEDNTECLIVSDFGGWDENQAYGEYPTDIYISPMSYFINKLEPFSNKYLT